MDILNLRNLIYQFPLALILTFIIVYKFNAKIPIAKYKLINLILRGIKIGIISSLVIPFIFGVNTFDVMNFHDIIIFLKKEWIVHLFILLLFILIGILSGISISVFFYNQSRKETYKKKSLKK